MSISHSQSGLAFETEELFDIRHVGWAIVIALVFECVEEWINVEANLYSFSSSRCSRGGLGGGTGLSYRDIGKPVRCSGASRDNIHSRVRALQNTTVRRQPRRRSHLLHGPATNTCPSVHDQMLFVQYYIRTFVFDWYCYSDPPPARDACFHITSHARHFDFGSSLLTSLPTGDCSCEPRAKGASGN